MKSKNIIKILICLLLALWITPTAYAEEAKSTLSEDLKNGDEILILESEPVPEVKKEEVIKEAPQAQIKKESNDTKKTPVEKTQPTYDPKTGEINDKVNSKENKTQATKPVEKPADTSELIKELDKANAQIKEILVEEKPAEKSVEKSSSESKENSPSKTTIQSEEYKKTLDSVTNALAKNKLKKEESEKIASETKNIIREYDKKIQNAKTDEEKVNLEKEASQKINDNIKKTSDEAYDYIVNEEYLTLEDQKDEKLIFEISPVEREKNTSKQQTEGRVETSSLARSPRLNQETSRGPYFPYLIILAILSVVGVGLALVIALRNRDQRNR